MKSQPHSYPRKIRIRKRADFLACYEDGQRFHSAHFLLFCRDAQATRFGVAASRKIGKAVRRNRVKRLLREFFRSLGSAAPLMELVAAAKKGAADLELADVENELLPLLRRAQKRRS